MEASNAPTIAACGYFDTIDFDSQIRLRVLRNELLRRIPGVEFHVFAPFGAIRRVAMAAAEVVEALCPITDERTEQFLNDFDLVVRVAAAHPRALRRRDAGPARVPARERGHPRARHRRLRTGPLSHMSTFT